MRSTSCESDNADAFEPEGIAAKISRLLDCRLARERALADQNTDVIDAHCAEGTSLCGGRNFVDLNDHAAS